MKYYLTRIRMALLKKSLYIMKPRKDVYKREPSYTVGVNVNCCSHYGEQYGGFLKN